MISFQPTEEERALQETIQRFASKQIRPINRTCEKERKIPDELYQRYRELGVIGLDFPESLSGAGLGVISRVLIEEELAWGDLGMTLALDQGGFAAYALLALGSEEQKRRWLLPLQQNPAYRLTLCLSESDLGSAGGSISCTAREDHGGYVLNGTKYFVPWGKEADACIVLARLAEGTDWRGVYAFVVPKHTPGLIPGREDDLMGLNVLHSYEVQFEACHIPKDHLLIHTNLLDDVSYASAIGSFLNRCRVITAARQIGTTRAAYEQAVAYARERPAFGKVIAQFQSIAFMVAEMAMEIHAARWLTWDAARQIDQGKDATKAAIQALVQANEMAVRSAIDAVQIHGGAGFCEDYPVEKWLRDVRTHAVTLGIDQVHNHEITQMTFGHETVERLGEIR